MTDPTTTLEATPPSIAAKPEPQPTLNIPVEVSGNRIETQIGERTEITQQVDVHITMPPARGAAPRRGSDAAASAAPRRGDRTAATGTPSSAGRAATGATSDARAASVRGVEHDTYRHPVDGALVHTYRDTASGSVSYSRDRTTGEYEVILRDLQGQITTHSNRAGFEGYRNSPRGYDGAERETMRAVPSRFGSEMYGLRGHIYCEAADGWLTTGQVAATDRVVSEATVDQIRQFTQRHPGLAEVLRQIDIPLTNRGGQSVNLDQIEAAGAPTIRACPSTDRDTIVQTR